MNGENVKGVGTNEWKDASFADKFKACLWYNREIKEICFGGGIAAFFQAAFTVLDKTVKNMNAIYKALHLRDAIVDAVQTTKAEEVNAALKIFENYNSGKPQHDVGNQTQGIQTQNQEFQTKIQEFLDLAKEYNGAFKDNLINNIKSAIKTNTVGAKISKLFYALTKVDNSITNKSKSADVKNKLAEATTKFDSDVKALLDEAVKNGAISEKDKEYLLNYVAESKTKTTQSINDKLAVLEKMEAQAARKAANEGKTEEQLLNDLDGKLSEEDKLTLQQVRDAAKATVDSAEKERAKQFLNLVVSELKEGREILEIKDCFDGDRKTKFSDMLYGMYPKQSDEIQQLSGDNKDLCKTKQNIIKPMLGKVVRDYCRSFDGYGTYVLSYDTICDEKILNALKALDNKDGYLTKRKNELHPDQISHTETHGITDEVSNLFYNLYVALEDYSPGSGRQLLFIPEQTAKDSCLAKFIGEIIGGFDGFARSYYTDNKGALQKVEEDKTFKYFIKLEMVDSKPSFTFGYDLYNTRLRIDISNVSGNVIAPVTNNFPMDVHLRYKLNAQSGKVDILTESKCCIAGVVNGTQAMVEIENNDAKDNEHKKMRVVQDIIPAAKQQ